MTAACEGEVPKGRGDVCVLSRACRVMPVAVLVFCISSWLPGCHSLRQELTEAALRTSWDESRLLADLRYLEAPSSAAGSELDPVVTYAAAQMYGLQPALAGSPVVPYTAQPDPDGPWQDGYNVMAYAAGSHPDCVSELIIVGADLDEAPFRQGLAALMEVARNYGLNAHRGFTPDRTIMVAGFSGHDSGYAGLRAYLRRPLWPVGSTQALVYLSPQDPASLTRALGDAGVPLHMVLPREAGTTATLKDMVADATRIAIEADSLLQALATREQGAANPVCTR